jgi:hypothetical protein
MYDVSESASGQTTADTCIYIMLIHPRKLPRHHYGVFLIGRRVYAERVNNILGVILQFLGGWTLFLFKKVLAL